MSHLYALINNKGIHRCVLDAPMTLVQMKNLVGKEGEKAYVEYVCNQFSDTSIDLICDEDFLRKGFLPTCVTQRGIVLHGQVIAAAVRGADTVGLTEQQFQIICQELAIAVPIEPNLN
jgi:hypothetical protein